MTVKHHGLAQRYRRSGVAGTVAAAPKKATAAAAGTISFSGHITAAPRKVTASVSGLMLPKGSIAAAPRKVTAALAGSAATGMFTDDFSAGITAAWTKYGTAAAMNAYGGGVRIDHTTGPDYNYLYTTSTYDMTSKAAIIEVVDAGNQTLTSHTVGFNLSIDMDNEFKLVVQNGTMRCYKNVATVSTEVGSGVTYSSTSHRWWRIRETGGTLYGDTSPDGGTWTNHWSEPNPWAVTALRIYLWSGCWQAEATASYGLFDNFNINAPSVPQYSSRVASAAFTARTGAKPVANGLPLSDAAAAALVGTSTWEPRPDNAVANGTVGPVDHADLNLNFFGDSGHYWIHIWDNLAYVTGNFTGTTDQIIQWASHKWGLDEDCVRAQCCKESWWNQDTAGDFGSGIYHSFGLTAVRDATDDQSSLTHNALGGSPYSVDSTAVNLDIYGAIMRAYFDGALYDGSAWAYGGQTVGQIAAANSWDYVWWGCVGLWYAGDSFYSSTSASYRADVQTHLANRTWEQSGF